MRKGRGRGRERQDFAAHDRIAARVRFHHVRVPAQEPQTLAERACDPAAGAHPELVCLQDALARLPEDQRLAVARVLVEGPSYKEAAEIMSVPVGTLTSRLARGREALQAMLSETSGVLP